MLFFPQTTVDGKSQDSDLSQVMEWMETSGKTTHLWVNNIDMDILVGPQAEHLCNCLIHTDRFCHENERARRELNAVGTKKPILLKLYSFYSNKSRFRTNCPFSVKILILLLLNRQSIDFLLKLKYTH